MAAVPQAHAAVTRERVDKALNGEYLRDASTNLLRVRVAAGAYGLTEIDRPYVRTFPEFVPGSGDPDTYFFWDESHVTAAVHRVLGKQLAASLPPEWTAGAADPLPAP